MIICLIDHFHYWKPGLLTRPEKDEAEVRECEAEAKATLLMFHETFILTISSVGND